MKHEEFKKLEKKINDQDFHKNYKNIKNVLFVLSIFGHFASIFLAYYLVSTILSGVIEYPIVVTVTSIILLSGLELLKREIFDKFSLQQIINKSAIHKDVLPLLIASIAIVGLSFYSSVKGAKEFSSKSKQIDTHVEVNVKTFEDSLNKVYAIETADTKAKIKDKENRERELSLSIETLSMSDKLDYSTDKKVKMLKNNSAQLKRDIVELNAKIADGDSVISSKVKKYEEKLKSKADVSKSENKNNSVFFVFISVLIEFVILIGVYFGEYYWHRSYGDFKTKIDKDPNFQKWQRCHAILGIMMGDETNLNDKLPSATTIKDMCKINGVQITEKDLQDVFKLFTVLGITKTSGNAKYVNKTKEVSEQAIKKHFNIS